MRGRVLRAATFIRTFRINFVDATRYKVLMYRREDGASSEGADIDSPLTKAKCN
jgi:hypothetical protein